MEYIDQQIALVKKDFVQDGRTALFKVEATAQSEGIVIKGETTFSAAKENLISNLSALNVTLIDSINLLPSKDLAGKIYGIVNISVCNIRSKPKHSGELATQAILGTPLSVLKETNGWYYIQTPDNYLGWLDAGGLQLLDDRSFKEWRASEKAICLNDFSFAHTFPDEESEKVTDLMAGSIVELQEEGSDYTKIRLPDNRVGYVSNEYLMPYTEWIQSRNLTASNILSAAHEMMGRPYLWGGTSGKGMDCSGFTKTVFYQNGVQLERDASLQVHTGIKIETDTTLKNLETGDLLFFGNLRKDGSERITHVAIYVGEGKMIHASERVKIESLKRTDPDFAEHRLNTFLQARRIIGSEGKNGIIALKDSPHYSFSQAN